MDTSDTHPTRIRRESDANPTTRPRRTAIDVHSSPVAAPSSSRRRRRVDDAEMSAPMGDFFHRIFLSLFTHRVIPLLFCVDTSRRRRRRRRRRRSSTRRARPREGHADRGVFESHRDVADGVRAARRRRVHDEGIGRALVRARNQRNRGVDDRDERAHLRAVRGWVLRSTGQHHLELGVLAGEPGVRHRGWIGSGTATAKVASACGSSFRESLAGNTSASSVRAVDTPEIITFTVGSSALRVVRGRTRPRWARRVAGTCTGDSRTTPEGSTRISTRAVGTSGRRRIRPRRRCITITSSGTRRSRSDVTVRTTRAVWSPSRSAGRSIPRARGRRPRSPSTALR